MAKILKVATATPTKIKVAVKPIAVKKIDNSIRNAKGQPTGKMSSGAGWGGEPPMTPRGPYQSKK
jgi:hypothetical protein